MTQAILTVGNIFSEAFQGLFELVHDMKARARHRPVSYTHLTLPTNREV